MVAVVSNTGKPLMPTSAYRARKLLKKGRAVIYRYRPYFTIQLLDREDGEVQEIEYKSDTGSRHVGISVCTETKELLSEQRDLPAMEPEHHNDRKKNRRTRRNRKRYRKPRFDNRAKNLAGGIKNGSHQASGINWKSRSGCSGNSAGWSRLPVPFLKWGNLIPMY